MKKTGALYTLAGLAAAILIFSFTGCSRPPRWIEPINFLDYTYKTLKEVNELSGDVEKFRIYYKENRYTHNLLEFLGGSLIEIASTYGNNFPGCVMRSLPDNGLVLETPLYVTEGRKNEALASIDKEVWYSTRNDIERGIDNFRNRYHIDMNYKREEKLLQVLYDLSIAFNETKEVQEVRDNRPVQTLKAGMVFKHDDKNRINYNLQDKIVYLPKGTVIHSNFVLEGNLAKTIKESGIIRFHILRNLYFYQRDKRFGFSLDNRHWIINIFAFKFDPILKVYADRDDHIFVEFGMYIDHKS